MYRVLKPSGVHTNIGCSVMGKKCQEIVSVLHTLNRALAACLLKHHPLLRLPNNDYQLQVIIEDTNEHIDNLLGWRESTSP